MSYVGCRCNVCGSEWDLDSVPRLIRQQRERVLKMSRKDLAEILSIKASTVATYENNLPSFRYYTRLKELVRHFPIMVWYCWDEKLEEWKHNHIAMYRAESPLMPKPNTRDQMISWSKKKWQMKPAYLYRDKVVWEISV
jgi:hypothetical protein